MKRIGPPILPDGSRHILRPFLPSRPNFGGLANRTDRIARRLLDMPPATQKEILEEARSQHSEPYDDVEARWLESYEIALAQYPTLPDLDKDQRILLGAYLTQSYAYEAVSLTNPSLVPIGRAEEGRQRFAMSARAIGEGHISSIAFLSGTIGPGPMIEVDRRSPHPTNGERKPAVYEKSSFSKRLAELGVRRDVAERALATLGESFQLVELEASLARLPDGTDANRIADSVNAIHLLAASNYRVQFAPDTELSRRVLSPAAPAESGGMEDARFVRFEEEDGSLSYYATYTAFDGRRILPQLIKSPDLLEFRVATMSGPMVHNKGMALFPKRIDGEFAVLSRQDNESIFLMRSDDVRHWSNAEVILRPEFDWEVVQIGNCGSPIETEHGWLVITHGVGVMRRYVLGAILLDLRQPSKVIGRLREPLLEPLEEEQHGLVSNVVYSCGGMIHDGHLFLPYGFADFGIQFAVGDLAQIVDAMA